MEFSSERLDMILDVGREAVEATKGKGPNAAREWLIARARKDSALADELIEFGADKVIASVYHQERQRVVGPARPDRAFSDDGLKNKLEIVRKNLMEWPLPMLRKPLGDATRPELAQVIQHLGVEMRTRGLQRTWLTNVHQLMADDKRQVRRVLTPQQVRTCRERAERTAEAA